MSIKSNFNRNSIILIVVSLFIALMGKISGLSILEYLSNVMIFIVAILCGPWAGFLTGAIILLIFTGGAIPSIYYDKYEPMYRSGYPEWLLFAFMGFTVGILAQKGFFKKWWSSLLAGYITAVTTMFLFIVLGQLFDRKSTGFLSLLQITEILIAFPAAFFGVFNGVGTNSSASYLIGVALISFAILKLPIAQWKMFIQGCPQLETTSAILEAKSSRMSIIAGTIVLLATVIYFSILLILAIFGLAGSG